MKKVNQMKNVNVEVLGGDQLGNVAVQRVNQRENVTVRNKGIVYG